MWIKILRAFKELCYGSYFENTRFYKVHVTEMKMKNYEIRVWK